MKNCKIFFKHDLPYIKRYFTLSIFNNIPLQNLWYKHWGCIDPFDYVTVEKYLKYIQYVKQNDGLEDDVVQLLPYLFKVRN